MSQYFFDLDKDLNKIGNLSDILKKDFELFYCQIVKEPMMRTPLIEFPIHHTHFKILSRIVLVKIGIYEGYENLDLFFNEHNDEWDSDELDELMNLHSWESKIFLYSSKLYFNELTENEVDNLYLDFGEIKSGCNDIWERFVNYKREYDRRPEPIWVTNQDSIKKKFKIWRQFWCRVWYDKTQKRFFQILPLGSDYGMSDCYGLDGGIYKR